MPKFVEGDKVLVNRVQVATIQTWDEDNNFLIYVVDRGGAPEYVNGHISSYDVEYLVAPAQTGVKPQSVAEELNGTPSVALEDLPLVEATDEYTTAGDAE